MYKVLFLKILRKVKFLRNRQVDFLLELNNREFTVPIVHELGFNNHNMDEFWMLDLFIQLDFGDKDILLDIGANVGQSLLKWKAANPNSPYIGLEPLPDCVEYLTILCSKNSFNDCLIIPKALFDKNSNQSLSLRYNDPTDRTASLIDDYKAIKSIEIETVDLNTLFHNHKIASEKIKIIKIDVEGSELEILENITQFLIIHKPIIIVEILARKQSLPTRIQKLNSLLNRLPYKLYRIKKKNNRYQGKELVDKISIPTSIVNSDYLMIPDIKP